MKKPGWLIIAVALAVFVAVQVRAAADREDRFVAGADVPTVAAGVDVLAGIPLIPERVRGRLPPSGLRRRLDRRHHRTGRTQWL